MTDSEIQEIKTGLKEITDKLDKYHESVTVLNTVVLGKNGDAGLIGNFEQARDALNKRLDENCKETSMLKVRFWLLIGLLMGSGLLGGIGIAQLIGG